MNITPGVPPDPTLPPPSDPDDNFEPADSFGHRVGS